MNKKIKKILLVFILILISVFPIIMKIYASSDYDGIIGKLKPSGNTDTKIDEIGGTILRIYTNVGSSIFICSYYNSWYNGININNCREKGRFKKCGYWFCCWVISNNCSNNCY